jgi:hypothetical protein
MSDSKSPATLAARGALKTDQLGRQVIAEASFQKAFTQTPIYAELSERCDCGNVNALIYTCVTGHAAFLACAKCGMHRAWLSHQTITFITEITDRFGRPTTVRVTHPPRGMDFNDLLLRRAPRVEEGAR